MWWGVLLTAAGCYLLKLLGFAVPAAVLERPAVRRTAELLPVALLAALVGVGTFVLGAHRLTLDARAAGLAAAVVALLLRAPFLVVVLVAAGVAALVRLI